MVEKVMNAQEYSAAGLSAIFSNLAKASDKQHKNEEAVLFRKLADFYIGKAAKDKPTDASFEKLAEAVKDDIATGFSNVRGQAEVDKDRGSLRALTWGEKVTKIQSAVLGRYARQQDALLTDTSIFVCDICGFIYIGDEAPAICPVCKVPSLKILEYK